MLITCLFFALAIQLNYGFKVDRLVVKKNRLQNTSLNSVATTKSIDATAGSDDSLTGPLLKDIELLSSILGGVIQREVPDVYKVMYLSTSYYNYFY